MLHNEGDINKTGYENKQKLTKEKQNMDQHTSSYIQMLYLVNTDGLEAKQGCTTGGC